MILLLCANGLFAQVKAPANYKSRNRGGSEPFPLTEAKAMPAGDMLIMEPQDDPVQSASLTTTLMRPRNLRRSGPAGFMAGMIGSVTAVAIPLKQFIYEHSSYDSGENEFSRPAVHIQPNIRRGSVWISMQLRY